MGHTHYVDFVLVFPLCVPTCYCSAVHKATKKDCRINSAWPLRKKVHCATIIISALGHLGAFYKRDGAIADAQERMKNGFFNPQCGDQRRDFTQNGLLCGNCDSPAPGGWELDMAETKETWAGNVEQVRGQQRVRYMAWFVCSRCNHKFTAARIAKNLLSDEAVMSAHNFT